MTRTSMRRFKKRLEAKQAELLQAFCDREGFTIDSGGDSLEQIENSEEREIAIRRFARESALLRDIRAALRHIEEKTFGTCVDCREPIRFRRLEAVPWALSCFKCQERAERTVTSAVESHDLSDVRAA